MDALTDRRRIHDFGFGKCISGTSVMMLMSLMCSLCNSELYSQPFSADLSICPHIYISFCIASDEYVLLAHRAISISVV
jgi:hypothetical protein